MNIDSKTTRLMGRVTDRMDLVRKYPHRYQIDPETLRALGTSLETIEALLSKITVIKAG